MPWRKCLRSDLGAVCILAIAALVAACQPGGGPRQQLSEPSPGANQRAVDEILTRYGGEYRNPALQSYVDQVGRRLLAVTPLTVSDVRFVMVDTDEINAHAVAGATVIITRGMLTWLNSEAELGAVLAHELAHLTEDHIARARLAERTAADRARAQGQFGLDGAAEASLLAYSRSQELEADRVGQGYLVAAGYDGRATAANLRQFQMIQRIIGLERGVDGPLLPRDSTMSTHPSSPERVAALGGSNGATGGETGVDIYLARIAGVPFGPHADDWQISGRRVTHPRAGIAFSLPSGFTMASAAGVLSGSGPQDSRMVVDFVTRDPSTTPAAFLNRDHGRIGARPAETRMIGGFPAAVIGYEGGSDDQYIMRGVLGVADDALLRVTALAPMANSDTVDSAFKALLNSLDHESALVSGAVRVVEIYEVRPGDMVGSLAQSMNPPQNAISLREELLRALNGLTQSEELSPGQLIKLVR